MYLQKETSYSHAIVNQKLPKIVAKGVTAPKIQSPRKNKSSKFTKQMKFKWVDHIIIIFTWHKALQKLSQVFPISSLIQQHMTSQWPLIKRIHL